MSGGIVLLYGGVSPGFLAFCKVDIRVGNDTKYARITAAEGGTVLPYVATAENGWHAVIVGDRVGWVSGKYSRTK